MPKFKVIPCSGMGKVYGLVARESALTVVKNAAQVRLKRLASPTLSW